MRTHCNARSTRSDRRQRRVIAVHIEIREEGPDALAEYASVPIAFRVMETLDLDAVPTPGRAFEMRTRPVTKPTMKDYDAQPGNSPMDWPARFDLSGWGILGAHSNGQRIGGAIVTPGPWIDAPTRSDTPDVYEVFAILRDIRIAPAFRRRGVGGALLAATEAWAYARGARVLEVETQQINVAACRFYARRGFELQGVNRDAYPDLRDEVQLLWRKRLAVSDASLV